MVGDGGEESPSEMETLHRWVPRLDLLGIHPSKGCLGEASKLLLSESHGRICPPWLNRYDPFPELACSGARPLHPQSLVVMPELGCYLTTRARRRLLSAALGLTTS